MPRRNFSNARRDYQNVMTTDADYTIRVAIGSLVYYG